MGIVSDVCRVGLGSRTTCDAHAVYLAGGSKYANQEVRVNVYACVFWQLACACHEAHEVCVVVNHGGRMLGCLTPMWCGCPMVWHAWFQRVLECVCGHS